VFTLDSSVDESRSSRRLALHERSKPPARSPTSFAYSAGGRCPTTGYLYLIMELVRGTTIAELTPSFPREMVSGVIAAVANGARHLEELKSRSLHVSSEPWRA